MELNNDALARLSALLAPKAAPEPEILLPTFVDRGRLTRDQQQLIHDKLVEGALAKAPSLWSPDERDAVKFAIQMGAKQGLY